MWGNTAIHVLIYIDRTDNAVKNHWNSTIKRKLDMGFYSGEVFRPNELEELWARVNKDGQVGCVSMMSSMIQGTKDMYGEIQKLCSSHYTGAQLLSRQFRQGLRAEDPSFSK